MVNDVLDPGPTGDYPHLPRNPDGTLDTTRVPVGIDVTRDQVTGRRLYTRLMPTLADGRPITAVAPLPEGQTPDDMLPRARII